MNLKQQISVELVKAVNSKEFTEEKLTELIEVPPSRELGDYSFPCFKLSKELKKDPKEIALNLKQKIESKKLSFIKKTETKGPYLNFFLDYSFLANALIPEVLKQKNKFGLNSSGKKKKIRC